jgi:hypothetical protein
MISPITEPQPLRKGLFFSLLLIFTSLNCLAQPAINAFSPASGAVGITVTITGANFSATPSDNIVFVGGVKANVTAATTNSLAVTVPAGAIYKPITVTTNGLTAYSKNPFIVTFTGAATQFTARSFDYAGRVDSVESGIETTNHAVGDFDGDNKMDVVIIDRLSNTMSVYRNTSTGSVVSFAPKKDFRTGNYPRCVTVADIDGDGKPDVLVSNYNDQNISIYKNTSVSGVISFASTGGAFTNQYPAGIAVADLDNDGKLDLVVRTINMETWVSVLRNTSSGGLISFAEKESLMSLAGVSEEVRTADIDGDGKTDIVLPDYTNSRVLVYRNTSATGMLSFVKEQSATIGAYPILLETGDLNSDGKPDLVVSYYIGSNVTVLTNTSSPGTIAFSNITNYATSNLFTNGLAINDLDGDGRPDIAVGSGSNAITLFRNMSAAGGAISFNSGVNSAIPFNDEIVSADFDNDGKPDLASESGIFRVTVWKNKTTSPQVLSFSPKTAGAGTTVTITGINFTSVNEVTFGGASAASFTVVNDNTITAVVGAGASGPVTVKAAQDSGSADGFVFTAPPVITGFTPTSGPEGAKITITGNYFMNVTEVRFGSIYTFYSVQDEHTIIATINSGATGDVSVTTQYGTVSAPGFTYTPLPKVNYFNSSIAGPGKTVEIGGTGFSGATAVSFGGVPARSFTVVSSTIINAVVDIGASGAIAVTTPYGTGTKDGFTFVPAPVLTSFSPAAAAYGEAVTITGTNFFYVSGVLFGGVPAKSWSMPNATTIIAYVGTGATGDITVTESYNNPATLPGFTYKPAPVINSFSPAGGPIGTTVTITGEHFANVQQVTFGGVNAASYTVVSANTIMAVTANGGIGSIAVVTDAGYAYSSGSFNFQYPVPEIISFTPASGMPGYEITIKGKDFVPGRTRVYFGNTEASFVRVDSETSLVATIGTGSSGDISIQTPGGSASKPGFTYMPPPPYIGGVAPWRGIEGTAVGISGDKFTGTTAVTFGGVPASSFTVVSDDYIIAIVGKGGTGDVAVTANGSTATRYGFYYGEAVINSITPATGGPGTVVTITGTGFVGVAGIDFGNAYGISATVNSPTSITVTVPTGGAGLVTVNFGDGSRVSSDAFTYQSPVTSIASVMPNVGGQGTVVSIKGSGFSQATAVTFGGVPAASYTVNSPNSITATVAGGASGNVSVTSPMGTGVLSGFSFTGAPIITRFSPEAAASGTTITITGTNFNPAAAANIVYVGGLKAEVITASEKTLTVKVPAGAPYSYISVTNNNLTGYSQKKFNTLFSATAPLSAGSFEAKIDSLWGTRQWHVNAADFDLDGKSDVTVCHSGSQIGTSHIALFKNNSVTGKLSFLAKKFLGSNSGPLNSVTGDLDGDGKLDLMVANALDGENLSVYRNASTGNNIAFDNEILLTLTGAGRNVVACTDVDADGKPDIIVTATYTGGKTTVYRNTSTIGNLSFVKVTISTPDYVSDIKVADMDLDGKPDLIMLADPNWNSLYGATLRNVSTPGTIAFETYKIYQTGPDPRHFELGDIDGDGRMDIVVSGGYSNTLSIVRNISIPGKIAMSSKVDFVTGNIPASVAVADMNGDGKADILASFEAVSKIVIYPNTGTPGNFTFGKEIELSTTAPVNSICVSDLDSDQRPDIIVSNQDAGSISFFRNRLSAFVLNSFSPAIGSTGTVVTIKGEELANATAVTIGGVPVSSFTVVDATTITAVVGAGNSGDVSVTTPLGTIKQSGFVYIGPPGIISFTPTTAGTGATVNIKGTYFTGTTAVSFGGVAARSFIVTSDSTISAVVGLGASGTVAVTTPLGKGTRDGFIYDPLTAIVEPGNANSKELTVKPNPVNDVLIIKHPASVKTATLRLVDITGRTVKVIMPAQGATETITSVIGLQAGVYTLVWSNGNRSLSRMIAVQ